MARVLPHEDQADFLVACIQRYIATTTWQVVLPQGILPHIFFMMITVFQTMFWVNVAWLNGCFFFAGIPSSTHHSFLLNLTTHSTKYASP
jgi:hypothetical protein